MKQGGCLKERTDVGRSKDQESAAGTHSARRNQRNTVAVERNSGEEIRRPWGVLERAFGGMEEEVEGFI